MTTHLKRATMVCAALAIGGCGASDELSAAEGYMPEDLPPWTCDTDASSGGGSESGCGDGTGDLDQCEGVGDCEVGYCVAAFDGDIGVFECRASCIESMDENQWCADASACCDPAATCERGYCITDAAGASSSTGDAP